MVRTYKGKRIGLMGLSANPPHDGHVAMARYAKDMLGLDEVWWVVANQNPNKSKRDMAPFEDRYEWSCIMAADHDWLKVTDFEKREGVSRSFDMLTKMKAQNPNDKFVWIIGDDNLKTFHTWYKWQDIMALVPIAVMARAKSLKNILSSPAAKHAQDITIDTPEDLIHLTRGLTILDNPLVPIKSTDLRDAFRSGRGQISGTHPEIIRQVKQKGSYGRPSR